MSAIATRRSAVLDLLGEQPGWTSAQALHAQLRERGNRLGLSTVYRHLQTMSDEGSVDTRRSDDGEIVYRRCTTVLHHHHLTCRICGDTFEVSGPPVERWAEQVAAEHGFRDVEHTVEITGVCEKH